MLETRELFTLHVDPAEGQQQIFQRTMGRPGFARGHAQEADRSQPVVDGHNDHPWAARCVPSYQRTAPPPLIHAPPWMKNRTGRRSAPSGAHTLR